MAVIANYKDANVTIENAYIKVERIWGSKAEGWNCWVGVYKAEGDISFAVPLFAVNAPYVEGENPFTALYKVIEEKFKNVVIEELVEEAASVEVSLPALDLVEVVTENKKTSKQPKMNKRSNS